MPNAPFWRPPNQGTSRNQPVVRLHGVDGQLGEAVFASLRGRVKQFYLASAQKHAAGIVSQSRSTLIDEDVRMSYRHLMGQEFLDIHVSPELVELIDKQERAAMTFDMLLIEFWNYTIDWSFNHDRTLEIVGITNERAEGASYIPAGGHIGSGDMFDQVVWGTVDQSDDGTHWYQPAATTALNPKVVMADIDQSGYDPFEFVNISPRPFLTLYADLPSLPPTFTLRVGFSTFASVGDPFDDQGNAQSGVGHNSSMDIAATARWYAGVTPRLVRYNSNNRFDYQSEQSGDTDDRLTRIIPGPPDPEWAPDGRDMFQPPYSLIGGVIGRKSMPAEFCPPALPINPYGDFIVDQRAVSVGFSG